MDAMSMCRRRLNARAAGFRFLLTSLVALTVCARLVYGDAPMTSRQSDANDTTAEVIRRLHLEGVRAQLRSDTATLERVWSDDHTFTNALGIVQTKNERLSEIRSGARRLESFDIDDIRVRVYHDTAVVTSRGRLKGQRDGQALDLQARGMDVYIKRDGRWQLVAAQATRIAQP